MRKETGRVLLIEVLLVAISLLQIFVAPRFVMWLYLLPLVLVGIFAYFFIGFPKRSERFSKDILLILIIGCISYYLIIYLIGYFSGFLTTGYQHTITRLIQNVGTHLIFIIVLELLRVMVVKKGKYNKKLVVFSIFVFFLLDITTKFSLMQISSKTDFLELVFGVFIPALLKNSLLTYITYQTSLENSIVYHCLIELPIYIVPIFPDLGDYIKNVFATILPLVLVIIIHKMIYSKRERIVDSKKAIKWGRYQKIFTALLVVLLVIIVLLVSGVGRYIALTIGSESMTGTINKGDVIIIDKGDKTVKKGEIIAFEYGGRVLVHRVVKISKVKGNEYYKTKGDANNAEDGWEVKPEMIVGKYKVRFMGIGWPTVKLSEWMMGGD